MREKRFFRVKLQKHESVEKMSELCVIDIYIVNLSNRFTFRGDKTDNSLMTRIEGARKFV